MMTLTYLTAKSILVNQTNIIGLLPGGVLHRLANREKYLYVVCQSRNCAALQYANEPLS